MASLAFAAFALMLLQLLLPVLLFLLLMVLPLPLLLKWLPVRPRVALAIAIAAASIVAPLRQPLLASRAFRGKKNEGNESEREEAPLMIPCCRSFSLVPRWGTSSIDGAYKVWPDVP